MEESKIQEIKQWGIDQVFKHLEGRGTISFKKSHKTRWGVTKPVKGTDPIQYEIEINHGENFEKVDDSYPYKEEITKDTILHEIAHALVGVKVCTHHSHDKIWKEYAKNLGAMPTSGTTTLSFRLWKEKNDGEGYSILGVPRDIRMNVFDGEKYAHVCIETQGGSRNNALTTVTGNYVFKCPQCNDVWIRKTPIDNENTGKHHDYYCSGCEIVVDDITDHWQEIFKEEGTPAYVKIMEEVPVEAE
ncbi:MAG: SprT-like domain-containing protein [Thermoplasmataceae archaeon]